MSFTCKSVFAWSLGYQFFVDCLAAGTVQKVMQ